jgi:hypothetical protein
MRARRFRTPFWALIALLAATPAAFSTTVVPVSFDRLVESAQSIFLAETIDVRSDWRTSSQGRHIVTTVTFKVERVLKGQVAAETRLEFLGGEIAGLVMEVDRVPRFRVGNRDVLFASGVANAVSPLVGFDSGRFPVSTDRSGRAARITMHDGRPFAPALSATSRTRSLLPRNATATTYDEFESLVLAMLARTNGSAR